jgi:hypothetical protein
MEYLCAGKELVELLQGSLELLSTSVLALMKEEFRQDANT